MVKVAIKDYQILNDARLEFDEGLTLIVGSSNNGKSAVIRAIEALIYNKAGNSFIRSGTQAAIVALAMNGHTVIWKKTPEAGVYKIDGQVYNKIGRGQLDEVSKALRISEIQVNQDKVRVNFLKQMEYPFLLDKNPSQLFEFLSLSNDTDRLSGVFKTMRGDLKQTESDINVSIGKVDSYKKIIAENKVTLENYKDVDTVAEKVLSYDAKFNDYKKLNEIINELKQRRELLLKKRPEIVKLRDIKAKIGPLYESIESRISTIQPLMSVISEVKGSMSSLESLTSEVALLKNQVQSFSSLDKIDINSIKSKDVAISELRNSISSLKSLLSRLSTIESSVATTRSALDQVKAQLSEFKVCPLCGQPLTEGVHDEH